MSSLFRHQSVRWVNAEGKRVSRETPGARKQVERSEYWWAKYRGADGTTKRVCLRVKDKQSAKQVLADLEKQEDRRKAGLEDRHTEHAARPLAEHITDWFTALKDGGTSQRRREDLEGRINKLVETAGWKRLADLTEPSVLAALVNSTARVP